MSVEITGREEEFRRLGAFLDSAPREARTLVLEGEAGIGKSTLWTAAVEAARERGMRVLAAEPAEAERSLGFAGLDDLFEGVLDRVLPLLAPPRRRALEVALLLETSSDGFDPRAAGVAVRNVLEIFAGDGPIVLAIDDVQWLDPSSSGALAFALRRIREHSVLVLLARRVGAGAEESELEDAIGAERVERLRLGQLSLGAIHRLLQARLGAPLPRPLVVRIHETSGGNPFYAIELARALGTDVDPTQPLAVPETLEGLLRARFDGLPEATRKALAFVSALGKPSDGLLEASAITQEMLEPALAAHVIERGDGMTRFAHPLLASVVYQGLAAEERRDVHRLVAEILDDPVARARHLALASDGPDADIAAILEEAAAIAAVRGVPRVAAELGELAGRLTPPHDSEGAHRRAIAAAHAQLRAGDLPRARTVADGLLAQTPEGPARAEALVLLSSVEARAGDLERAIRLRREALGTAADPALQASIHQWLGANVRYAEGLQAGEAHARVSLELAERLGDDALRAGAMAILALLRFNAGEPDAAALAEKAHELATAVAERQQRLSSSVTLPHVLAWTMGGLELVPSFVLADVLIDSARFESARPMLEDLFRALHMRDELASAEVLWHLSRLELQAGRLALAADHIDRVQEIKRQYTLDRDDPGVLVVAAGVALYRGALELARELATRGLDVAEGNAEVAADLEAALGFIDRWSGSPKPALARFEAAERVARAAGRREPNAYWWRAESVEALVELGLLDEAIGLLDAWEADAVRVGREWVLAQVTRCRGLVAAARGQVDVAVSTLEQAVTQHEAVGDPFGRARALLALGVTRRRGRQKRAAREAIEAAVAGFEEIGADGWAERSRSELGRIGGRTRVEGLTAAERRVAQLVVEGRTNREVAAALVLGERTVETHLTHIYAKLGVRSRTELARTLQQAS